MSVTSTQRHVIYTELSATSFTVKHVLDYTMNTCDVIHSGTVNTMNI